jgi:hypothetical protein
MREESDRRLKKDMEPKFKKGEIVYDRVRPTQKLIIRNQVGQIYYCMDEEHPHRKELVFFERDLMAKTQPGLNGAYPS